MQFLLEAAYACALLAPAASRSMTARARGLAKANKFEIHSSLRQKYCGNCSQILVPGANCRVRIGPWRKRRSHKRGAEKAGTAKKSSRWRGKSLSAADGKKEIWAGKPRQGAAREAAVPFRRRLKRLCHACAVCGHVQSIKVDATCKSSRRPDTSERRKANIVDEARNAKLAAKRGRATVEGRDGKSEGKGKGKEHQGGLVPRSGLASGVAAARAALAPQVSAPAVPAVPSEAVLAADVAAASVAAQGPERSARNRQADLRAALTPAKPVANGPGISAPTVNASAAAGRRANLRSLLAPTSDVSCAPPVTVQGGAPAASEGEQGDGKRSKRRRGSDRMGMALAGKSMGDDFML